MKTNLRGFLQQNRKTVSECGGFEIYDLTDNSQFLPYCSYYFTDDAGNILDEGKTILSSATEIRFTDEDYEPIFSIALDDEFEIEGADGDWFLYNERWHIYV